MEIEKKNIYTDNDFESYIVETMGVIYIKDNIYNIVTDIPESSNFFDVIMAIENNPDVKTMIISNEEKVFGNNAYEKYLNTIFSHEGKEKQWSNVELTNREKRTRQLVILNKMIKKIVNFPKLVVVALIGDIVTPFFGASLAADIRIAAENVTFSLSHIKMNIHPSGALPYFLPKYIGHGKSSNILFGNGKLSLDEASELGLISAILPDNNFLESVIEKISESNTISDNAYKCSKKLLNSNFNDLEKYLALEESAFKN